MPEILPPHCYPVLLVLYTAAKLIFPLRTRRPLWKTISLIMTAPFHSPTFFETFIADVFTSMVKIFQDILWIFCYVGSGDFLIAEDDLGDDPHPWQHRFWYKKVAVPLICLAPLWIRFFQCIRRFSETRQADPNLLNALKYALSQTVTLFGAFYPLYLMHSHSRKGVDLFQIFWMFLFIASSVYSWWWDVYKDWGLGRSQYAFLGSRLMFSRKMHYYVVIFLDLFLRFMWVLTLIPPNSGANFELPNYLHAITMMIELFRRTLWGFFRLENEHRCNSARFRRVDFVPLHFDTERKHKYKQEEKKGWNVLGEVFAVTFALIGVSISSFVVAKHNL